MAGTSDDSSTDLNLIHPTNREILAAFLFKSMETAVNNHPNGNFKMADLERILGVNEVKTVDLFQEYTDFIEYMGQYAKVEGIENCIEFNVSGDIDCFKIHPCINVFYQQKKTPKFREVAEILVMVRALLSKVFVPLSDQIVRQIVNWTIRILDDVLHCLPETSWKRILASNHECKSIMKNINLQTVAAVASTTQPVASTSGTQSTSSTNGQPVDLLQLAIDQSCLTPQLAEHAALASTSQVPIIILPPGAKPLVGCTCGAFGGISYFNNSISRCKFCKRFQCLDCGEDFKTIQGTTAHRRFTKTHSTGTAFVTTQHVNHINNSNQATGPPLSAEIETLPCGDQCPGTKADNYKLNQYMSKCLLCSKIRCLICGYKNVLRCNIEKHVTAKHKLDWLLPVDRSAIDENVIIRTPVFQ